VIYMTSRPTAAYHQVTAPRADSDFPTEGVLHHKSKFNTSDGLYLFGAILLSYAFTRAADETINTYVRPHLGDGAAVGLAWSVLVVYLVVVLFLIKCCCRTGPGRH
jgi:hypothetical protein